MNWTAAMVFLWYFGTAGLFFGSVMAFANRKTPLGISLVVLGILSASLLVGFVAR